MRVITIGSAVALLGLFALVSCTEDEDAFPDRAPIISDTDDVDAFATEVLDALQPASIAESIEYCGYIYTLDDGTLAATPARRGGEDFCDLPEASDDVIASFHTHGGYSDLYDNEVPSVDDALGDFESQIDGYVGTPAGRVWLIDYETRLISQVCGSTCITSDPNDDPSDAGFIPQTFTLEELRARFE